MTSVVLLLLCLDMPVNKLNFTCGMSRLSRQTPHVASGRSLAGGVALVGSMISTPSGKSSTASRQVSIFPIFLVFKGNPLYMYPAVGSSLVN